MDKKLRETTNLGVEIMNSKRQEKLETWSSGTNSRLPFDVNAMLNLSIGQVYPSVTVPEVFGRANSAQFPSLFSRRELSGKDKFALRNDFLSRVEWSHNGLLR